MTYQIGKQEEIGMKLYVVDAFTTVKFSGNQAGVTLLEAGEDFPADSEMQALAAELKHSETAFVKQTGPKACHIRYFTPAGEVDLCGHATIASFTLLRELGLADEGVWELKTMAGELKIAVEQTAIWMDMAPPRELRAFQPEEYREFYAAYGLTDSDRPQDLIPRVVNTGLSDIMLPVCSQEALDRAVQDREAVIALSQKYDVVGFHMFCVEEDAVHCRNFAPLYEIDEEAATGTSNGALTYYLWKYGNIRAEGENLFLQGEKMGKPSEIRSRLHHKDGQVSVQIGGRAVASLRLELL